MADKLKPCPFCGGNPAVQGAPFFPAIKCPTKGCPGSTGFSFNEWPETVAAWNKRPGESK